MAKVVVEKNTKTSPKEAFSKIRSVIVNDEALRKLDRNYTCQFDESRLEGCAKGGKFKADLMVKPSGDGSNVCIAIELSFFLAPFKEKVREILQGRLDEQLNDTQGG